MPASTTLLIAYPKELIRSGLRAMIGKSPIKIVGEVIDAAAAVAAAKKLKPHVLLLDTAIPGGDCFDVLRAVRKSQPDTRIVVLSALDNPTYMARAKAVGATDFLLESVSQKDLVAAIQNAASGRPPAGPGPFTRVAAAMEGRIKPTKSKVPLSPRETQVLAHIAYGLPNKEIATSLSIGVETVKEHVANILRKLAVTDRTHAAVWAVQSGFV